MDYIRGTMNDNKTAVFLVIVILTISIFAYFNSTNNYEKEAQALEDQLSECDSTLSAITEELENTNNEIGDAKSWADGTYDQVNKALKDVPEYELFGEDDSDLLRWKDL